MLDVTKRAIQEMVRKQAAKAHMEGMGRYGKSRRITSNQEIAYRLCHHAFYGLRQIDTAEVMGTSQPAVSRLLSEVEAEAPQLFPILSPRIAKMYDLFMEGHTCTEIAKQLDTSPRVVQKAIRGLYKDKDRLGLWFRPGPQRRLSYQPWQDEYIKEVF